MIDLLHDPYFIVVAGTVFTGLLILKGAALIQDKRYITGWVSIVVASIALLTAYILATNTLTHILKVTP